MIRSAAAWGRLLLVAAPVLASVGCANAGRPTHVACLGDSITAGDGASSPATSYPAVLQGLFGKATKVEGFGHSGATALGAEAGDLPYELQPEYADAARFVSDAGPSARVAVVVLLGANDSKEPLWDAAGGHAHFREDYGRILDHFAALPSHPTLYVATPLATGADPCCGIRGDVLTRDITPMLRALAKEHGAHVIDLASITAGHADWLVDGVHPNDAGYLALATRVRDAILQTPPRSTAGSAWW